MKSKSLYHWLVAASCCGLMVSALGISVNSSGVFFVPVSETLGVGRGDVAMYLTIMQLVTGLAGPLATRWVRWVPTALWLGVGGFGTAACLLLWSGVTAVWQLYVLAALHGICNTMIGGVMVNLVIGSWFNKNVGLVMGLAFSFSGVSGALLSPLFQRVIEASGWQTAHNLAALLAAVVVLPALLLVRLDPRERRLLPYGGEADSAGGGRAGVGGEQAASRGYAIFVVIFAGFAVAFLTGLGQHVSGYATTVGLTAADGALLVSAVMVGNMSSKLIFGICSDRIGPRRTFLILQLLTILGLAGFLALAGAGFAPILCAALLLGFAYSLGSVGLTQLCRGLFVAGEVGRFYAWATMAANAGNALASAAIGYAFDLSGSYFAALFGCLILDAVAWAAVAGLGVKGKRA